MTRLYGGMEGGGSKFVCAVGKGNTRIIEEISFPTTSPDQTLNRAIAFFKRFDLSAIGLAPFGPLDLNNSSPTFGTITATPKPGWAGIDVLDVFRHHFDLPLVIDLDVNAAAFAEYSLLPANRGLQSMAYLTIGTGIGVGFIINGKISHGLTHPEAGHIFLPHNHKEDPFPGICPFHGDCFEGMASGPAMARRWRKSAEFLPDHHPAWELEARYISFALANIILAVSPQRILLGGGVMQRSLLFPLIRDKLRKLLNGYITSPVIAGSMEDYLLPPALGNRSGVLGAIALARKCDKPADKSSSLLTSKLGDKP